MPVARVLPKKFMGTLLNMQDDLRLVALKCRQSTLELEARVPTHQQNLRSLLQEVESTAYRLAYELSQLRIAGACDECPSAPASTLAQTHLLILADELERQAEIARQRALTQPDEESRSAKWGTEVFTDSGPTPNHLM